MSSAKPEVIERLFEKRWQPATRSLTQTLVTLNEVSEALREHNAAVPSRTLSDRNPANFFKDFIRNKQAANRNWPASVLGRGYTARQVTGGNACFEFVPLASRRLGRSDEPWLIQVLVRLRVIETHLSLFSRRSILQVDHLQMSVKLARSEIDALFLAIEESGPGATREVIVSCEAKGRRDDILEDQVLRQVQAVFRMAGVTQDLALPIVVKTLGPSEIHVVEFEAVSRKDAEDLKSLVVASEAVYELVPPVPGIGV